MAKLSKTQNYAIQWLVLQDVSPEDISDELDIELSDVNKVIKKFYTTNNQIKTTSSVVGDKKKNLMIMETATKKNKSVAIMTKEASQQSDSIKNKHSNRQINKNIYKPKKK
jgi:predicted DNA-binding protein YlxM (UPF0122 family)